jgi:hypothetical protein
VRERKKASAKSFNNGQVDTVDKKEKTKEFENTMIYMHTINNNKQKRKRATA